MSSLFFLLRKLDKYKYKNKSFSFSLDLIHLSVIEYNSNYYYNLMSVPFYYCMSGQKVFFKRFLIDAKKEKRVPILLFSFLMIMLMMMFS